MLGRRGLRWAQKRLRRAEKDGGFSTLEAVITMPVLITLILIVVQTSLVFHGRNVAYAAAAQAVEVARGLDAAAADGEASAREYLGQVAPNLLPGVVVTASRSGTSVTVRVQATVRSVVPFADFSVDESVTGPVEQYQTSGGS